MGAGARGDFLAHIHQAVKGRIRQVHEDAVEAGQRDHHLSYQYPRAQSLKGMMHTLRALGLVERTGETEAPVEVDEQEGWQRRRYWRIIPGTEGDEKWLDPVGWLIGRKGIAAPPVKVPPRPGPVSPPSMPGRVTRPTRPRAAPAPTPSPPPAPAAAFQIAPLPNQRGPATRTLVDYLRQLGEQAEGPALEEEMERIGDDIESEWKEVKLHLEEKLARYKLE